MWWWLKLVLIHAPATATLPKLHLLSSAWPLPCRGIGTPPGNGGPGTRQALGNRNYYPSLGWRSRPDKFFQLLPCVLAHLKQMMTQGSTLRNQEKNETLLSPSSSLPRCFSASHSGVKMVSPQNCASVLCRTSFPWVHLVMREDGKGNRILKYIALSAQCILGA